MLSIIVPTMLVPENIENRIRSWAKSSVVKEIIVINNTNKDVNFSDEPKIRHVFEGINTFINPAWNKGYMLSTTNKLCIANDDVDFDIDVFEWIEPHITDDKGMIGLHEYHGTGIWEDEPGCDYNRSFNRRGKRFPFKLIPTTENRRPGYACFWFIHKTNYKMIPENMKVYFGDDYVYYKNGKQNYSIMNFDIVGKVSQTTSKPEIHAWWNNDSIIWSHYRR